MLTIGTDGLPVGRKKANYSNIDGLLYKRCTKCGNVYRLKHFYVLNYLRNGKKCETLQSWCKFCMCAEIGKRIKEKRIKKVRNI